MPEGKERALWADGLRFACVPLIFFVHDGLPGGPNLAYIGLAVGVPAFFAVSGLFAERAARRPLGEAALRRAWQLGVPYWVFGVLTLLVCAVFDPALRPRLPAELLRLALGRRNDLFAAALWFLPCLWCVSVLYRALFSPLKSRALRLALAAAVSLAARLLWEEPVAVLSLNAALRYLVYYALGDALGPLLLPRPQGKARAGCAVLGVGGLALCAGLYAAGPAVLAGPLPGSRLSAAMTSFAAAVGGTALLGWLGAALGRCPPLSFLGRHTLLFCCTEALARPLLDQLLALFGIGLHPQSLVGRLAVTALLIGFIAVVFIVPVTRFCPWLAGQPPRRRERKKEGQAP